MEKQPQSFRSARFGQRKVAPFACVIDRKKHIRTFLCNALEELGFITSDCANIGELKTADNPRRPNIIILGLSTGIDQDAETLKALAIQEFDGKILLLGPRASPMTAALQEFGEQLGLEMLPALLTPFDSTNLCNRVAMLLPVEAPQPPSVEVAEALSAGWLELWYQPQINTQKVALSGAEALIRMRHPTSGIVAPAYFIPDEGDPQFLALSEFVIDQAIRDWHNFVAECGPVEIAINLPLAFFLKQDAIQGLCRKLPVHPAFEGFMIEINSVEVIRDLPLAKAVARQLRFHNIGISIDDVGAEWPSLMGLEDFPFVELKVDREFVSGCADDPSKKAVCRHILRLADGYGIRSVAEGVEAKTDFLAVREMGFDLVQGFLFGKPMMAKKLAHTVLRHPAAV
jgi:EAL domain-containing protein (putative c-di-GMP-specific phosphodiesterase class I)